MVAGRRRITWLALAMAACLGFGVAGPVVGQDSNGNITISQGNGSASSQGNDEGDGGGGQSQAQRQAENQRTVGSLDQVNDASNESDYAQQQQTDSAQDNANGATQANSGVVSDIGGDDNGSDDDDAGITGNGNEAAEGDVIAALVAVLLLVLGEGLEG